MKVKGNLVKLEDCAKILAELPEVEEWQIELTKKDNDPLEVDEMVIHLALHNGCNYDEIRKKVCEAFKGRIEISPNRVELLDLPSMLEKIGMETEMKEKRFVDSRPKP